MAMVGQTISAARIGQPGRSALTAENEAVSRSAALFLRILTAADTLLSAGEVTKLESYTLERLANANPGQTE